MNQSRAPIVEAIESFVKERFTPFAIPGHKAGHSIDGLTASTLGYSPYQHDVMELSGFDDRKESKGYKEQAQQLVAEAYHADQAFFSTNGSTLSAHVTVMTMAGPGDRLIVVRNSHKSIIAGLILAGVTPHFVQAQYDERWDLYHGTRPGDLKKAFKECPDAKGAIVLNPTYFGVSPDLKKLVDATHEKELPIAVDEAWGSHFPFCSSLPENAMSAGADLSYSSMHKTEEALAQCSIITMQGKRISSDVISRHLELMRSTSESGLLLAAMDANRRQMMTTGEKDLHYLMKLATEVRKTINEIGPFEIMGKEHFGGGGAFDQDISKIVIDVSGLGISGYELDQWLRENEKITLEMARCRDILAVLTIGDDECSANRLVRALSAAADHFLPLKKKAPSLPPMKELETTLQMSPREAFFAPRRSVPIEKAAGEVIAELVCPYPPGIPVLVPGEVVTPAIVEYLTEGTKIGLYCSDVKDQSLKSLQVVAL